MAGDFAHRPPRGIGYHESAIAYNKEMAKRARELANSDDVTDQEVKRWCRAIARQHDEHIPYHERALRRLRKQKQRKKEMRQQRKKGQRDNRPPQNNGPKPAPPSKEVSDEKKTPVRPIPRDPRIGRQFNAAVGVGTNIEKQEASA